MSTKTEEEILDQNNSKIKKTTNIKISKEHFTVGDLIKELQKLPKDLPIIYSHDDEGNEFQMVNQPPCVMRIRELTNRFIEVLNPDEENYEDGVEAVCIN